MKVSFKFNHLFCLLLAVITFIANAESAYCKKLSLASVKGSKIGLFEKEFVHKFLKPGEYLHESDVKEGDTGYGLSVFHGTKVERFNVKVIGVMKQALNGRDSILVRISGDVLGKNNLVRGMSGSPIYINDKLVGALSYGFDFSKEPIVGVTPIVDMLDAIIKPGDDRTIRTSRKRVEVSSIRGSSLEASKLRQSIISAGAPKMVPLMTPVSTTGFSPRAQKFLQSKFKPYGLEFAQGGGGAVDNYLLSKVGWKANILKPGSAVSLLLSTGDFTTAGTGTVTGIFDKRILAFGHPMMEAGAIDIPMSSAYIHEILPSLSVSFKLSSPLKILGHIFADRPWSVGGEIGKYASMIPVDIVVVDGARGYKRKFHSEVVNHPDFTSSMISAIAMSAMDATFQSTDPYTVKVNSQIKVKDGAQIEKFDQYASFDRTGGYSFLGMQFFSDPVVSYLDKVVSKVYDNKFQKSEVEKINLRIEFDMGKTSTKIERVVVENPIVEPGDSVNLKCVMKPFGKERIVEKFQIKVPRDVPDGDFMVGIAGGAKYKSLRKSMKLYDPLPQNFDEMIEQFVDKPSSDKLVAILALPNQAIHVDGSVLQSPPGHWSKLFFSDRYTNGPSLVVGEKQYEKELDAYITGSHVVGFKVKRKKPYEVMDRWFLAKSSSAKPSRTQITSQARKVINSIGNSKSKKTTGSTKAASVKKISNSTNFAGKVSGVHTRNVRMWNQYSDSSFSGGELKNATIDSWGRLFPGFEKSANLSIDSDIRAWSSTMHDGVFYFATSNEVFSWTGTDSKPVSLTKFESKLIPSMASDSTGKIYVACVPGGKVMVLDGSSKKLFFKTRESTITQLAVDGSNNLYIGVAGSGKVYKVNSSGALLDTIDTGQAHVTSLSFSKNLNSILVGTGETGNVYSLSSAGALKPLFQTDQHIVTGAAFDKRGNLFVSTAGKGNLLMVDKTGKVNNLATSDAFYHLVYDPKTDSIFTGDAEGDITQIQIEPLPDRSFFVPVNHTKQEAVISLNVDDQSNLYVLTSNLPTVQFIRSRPVTESYYVSSVMDASRNADWSTLKIHGAYNQFNPKVLESLKLETRTGFTRKPDQTWSQFVACERFEDGFKIGSPDGRYFQYKLSWNLEKLSSASSSSNDRTFPLRHESSVGRVMTTYLPENNKPKVRTFNLSSGEFISGKKKLKLNATDPDGDNMILKVELSSDNGKSWKLLKDNLVGKSSSLPSKDKSKDKKSSTKDSKEKEKSKKVLSNDKSKEKSSEIKNESMPPDTGRLKKKKKLLAFQKVRALVQLNRGANQSRWLDTEDKKKEEKDRSGSSGESQEKKASNSKKDEKKISKDKKDKKSKGKTSAKDKPKIPSGPIEWTWNTKKQKDGIYILRFTLSDALSNGGSGLSNKFYRTVVVDNKPPQISDINQSWSGKTLAQFNLKSKDSLSPIVNAVFEADTKESYAFVPEAGLMDRKKVSLKASGIKFSKKPKKLKVVVTDKAGNKAEKEIKVRK